MKSTKKEIIISFVKSFLGNFITFALVTLSALPPETFFSPDFYKSSTLIALVGAVIRSALSETWKVALPVSVGGVK